MQVCLCLAMQYVSEAGYFLLVLFCGLLCFFFFNLGIHHHSGFAHNVYFYLESRFLNMNRDIICLHVTTPWPSLTVECTDGYAEWWQHNIPSSLLQIIKLQLNKICYVTTWFACTLQLYFNSVFMVFGTQTLFLFFSNKSTTA